MSRQVFYKYFVDKYDLVHWIYDQDSLPGDDLYNSSKDYTDYSRHTLKVFIENENFYKNALSDIQSQNAFFKHWFKNGKARMMFNIGKSNINDEVDIAMDVYIYGTLFVVLNWLFSDQKKNQEVLARLLIKSMPSILKKYLLVK